MTGLFLFAAVELPELSVLLAGVFAAFATLVGVLLKYMEKRETDSRAERKDDKATFTAALTLLGKQIQANTEQSEKQILAVVAQTNEIAKGNREAEKRNGHLAELALEGQKSGQDHQKVLVAMIESMGNTITEQVLDHSFANGEEVKKQSSRGQVES